MDKQSRQAAQHLEAAYRRIADERMLDLPICNDALAVESVGFDAWDGHILGVLITPWCMNLVLMPGSDDDWSDLARESHSEWDLPAGTYQFNPCLFDDVELHLSAPLFSTVQDFPDQTTARAIAAETLCRLRQPGESTPVDLSSRDGRGDQCADAMLGKPLSRRGLLRRMTLLER